MLRKMRERQGKKIECPNFLPDTLQHSANGVAQLPGGDLKKFQNICRMSQIVFKPLITSYRIVTAFEERLLVRLMYVYKFTEHFY